MKESAEISINTSQQEPKSTLLRNVAFLLGVSVLALMIYKVGVFNIWENILNTGWWFIPIIGVWGVVYIANACSWYAIISDGSTSKPPFWKVWKFTISGFSLNYITPMGLAGGEPYKIMELKAYLGTEKATAYVILHMMMHVCSHFLFWITSVALIALVAPMSGYISVMLMAIFLVCVALIFLFYKGYRNGLVLGIVNKCVGIPFIGKKVVKFRESNKEKLVLIDKEIAGLHGSRKVSFYLSLLMEYVARLINCMEIYFIAMALGAEITYAQALIISAISSLFANILFFSPMQLGTREGGFLLSYKAIGLAPAVSITVSLITRIRELFWIFVGLMLMKIGNDD